MTTFEIYEKIINSIEAAMLNNVGEVKIVKDSIDKIKELTWESNINVRAGFCHQKPYAFLIKPTSLFTKQKTELGDYLFVIKYVDNNEIIDKRALFFQAKYNILRNKFPIELHQFHFYKQISDIEFKFGNSIYEDKGITPIIWKSISANNEFGDYFLIGQNRVMDIATNEIAMQYEHKKSGHFSFDFNFFNCWHWERYQKTHCCLQQSPLFDFLTPFGKGNKILGQFEIFINLIYKRLEMLPDPIEEHEGFWMEESKEGFGLIEITINNNENFRE